MASQHRIIIQNMSGQETDFYAFQKQATFVNSGDPSAILSSSLAYGPLAPHDSSGAQLEFDFDAQVYVGVKSTVAPPSTAMFSARISLTSMNASSNSYAVQSIELTPSTAGETANNFSVMTASPLGLSAPRYEPGLDAGYFGVEVPAYSSASSPGLYCGCAAINQDRSITLSSFIAPRPNSQVTCAPVATYYVKVGRFPTGQVVTYDIAQSAECDFAEGQQSIVVTYNSDGTFTTENK